MADNYKRLSLPHSALPHLKRRRNWFSYQYSATPRFFTCIGLYSQSLNADMKFPWILMITDQVTTGNQTFYACMWKRKKGIFLNYSSQAYIPPNQTKLAYSSNPGGKTQCPSELERTQSFYLPSSKLVHRWESVQKGNTPHLWYFSSTTLSSKEVYV